MEEEISDHETTDSAQTSSGRLPLGALLTAAGFLTEAQLSEALGEGATTGERLGEVVVRRGWTTEDEVAKLLAEQWHLPYVDRASIYFDVDALSRMSRQEAQHLEALPTRVQDGRVVVAVAEPTEQRLTALRAVIGEDTVVVVVPKTALEAGLRSELLSGSAEEATHGALGEQHEQPPARSPVQLAAMPAPPRAAPGLAPLPPRPEHASRTPAGAGQGREPELNAILTALAAATADAAALGASMGELSGRLAELVDRAAAAAARLSDGAETRSDDRRRINQLEQQLAQRTELTESLKQQLVGLTRTLDDL
ncbi:MAG: hypothetical protein ABIR67_02465 [Gaiellaceae bacterium]